jgi:hypothetical protein
VTPKVCPSDERCFVPRPRGFRSLPRRRFSRIVKIMEVHFNNDLEARLHALAIETGRPMDALVEDAIAGYLDEVSGVRETLNNRYDELKSGRVSPIDGEAFDRLKAKTERNK